MTKQLITSQRLEELGKAIEASFDEKLSFLDLAHEKLKEFLDENNWNREVFLRDFMTNAKSKQLRADSNFGEPPLTVFLSPKGFCIDIYIWVKVHTFIHNHGFEGVFTVLEGSTLNGVFNFDVTAELPNTTQLGVLSPRSLVHLKAGVLTKIPPAPAFIHQAIHLNDPTVTLIVRTLKNTGVIQREFDLRKKSNIAHPSDIQVAKTRLLEHLLISGLVSPSEVKKFEHIESWKFHKTLLDHDIVLDEEIATELSSSAIIQRLYPVLSYQAKTCLAIMEFFRSNLKIHQWWERHKDTFGDFNEAFYEILTALFEQDIINQEMFLLLKLLCEADRGRVRTLLGMNEESWKKIEVEVQKMKFLEHLLENRL